MSPNSLLVMLLAIQRYLGVSTSVAALSSTTARRALYAIEGDHIDHVGREFAEVQRSGERTAKAWTSGFMGLPVVLERPECVGMSNTRKLVAILVLDIIGHYHPYDSGYCPSFAAAARAFAKAAGDPR
jgi:hypothetical protein